MRLSPLLCGLLLTPPFAAAADPVKFNRDVRPILAENCFGCHGAGKQKGGLRLDTFAAATTQNKKSGFVALVPKKPGDSEAIRRVFSTDETEVMPPADSHKTLTGAQKAVLKRWVEEGAVYEPHWAFAPLMTAPPVPKGNGHGTANPIDAFLEAALAKKGLTPNPEADKSVLLRRVAFTLTGLPPTPKEQDEFLADTKPGAYERMVERYFDSPRHGEEMARHWLDLARYADTHGLHLDNERGMWPYRDWVVRAFNENMPFDRFTVAQVAGDLLPAPTTDQLVATGFNRCNVSTGEGGSIGAEWYFRNAVDRAAVATETWLGLTAGCAQCHDHKFDPISQKEFYSLYAFFYSAAGAPLDGNALYHEPSVKLTTPAQRKKLAEFDRRLKAVDAAIAAVPYTDPGLVAAATGGGLSPEATDIGLSFVAWVAARGGPDAAKLPKPIAGTFAALGKGKRPTPAQLQQSRAHYLRSVCVATDAVLDPLMKSKEALTAARKTFDAGIPSSMIFRDAPRPRQAHVMLRGQYDKPGDKVEPGTPAIFPKLGATGRATRLDLARWLVRSDHPLTARVYVNRLWQQVFGVGLVKTSSDFGIQGEPPVNPDLLDWLAADFRATWDTRAAVRRMVLSAAFRRSSRATPALLHADPENRLLARGPRLRLDAEQVRDNALAVSGLIDLTLGGKGVKPYQPDNIWEPVGFTGSNTRNYKRGTGSDLYRRTIYTFYKRTAPPPYMVNLDSPNREQPCPRRDRSNTPLQALQLLNDTQHVEAARVLAERILIDGGASAADRIRFAFKLLLARAPTATELAIVTAELTKHRARYAQAPADAARLLAVGDRKANPKLKADEVAAYALVASMLLNLDETLTRN